MSNVKPRELDPVLTAALLRGLAEDIENGRVKVHALERIKYAGATTLVVNFETKK